jgi:hypothetical protein
MKTGTEVVARVERCIASGTPEDLERAVYCSLLINEYEHVTRDHLERLHELSVDWWARYDTLNDAELDEIDEESVRYYRHLYPPPTPEPEHDDSSAPREPERGRTRSDLPPITELEAEWMVRCLESEDNVREFAHYAGLVGEDGALPIEPLLTLENRRVYGHAIAPRYRSKRMPRPWGTRRRRWEYELVEDALLAAAIGRGRLTGRERYRVVWRLVPYMPLLDEKAIHSNAKRIQSGLLRRGVFERVSCQCVRLTEDGARRIREQLVEAWLPYAVEEV